MVIWHLRDLFYCFGNMLKKWKVSEFQETNYTYVPKYIMDYKVGGEIIAIWMFLRSFLSNSFRVKALLHQQTRKTIPVLSAQEIE